MPTPLRVLLTFALALAVGWPLTAQWSNRYPRMSGFGHHVYVEGYDFPTVAAGPTYPAAAPDGRRLAFSARGWIWILDLAEDGAPGVARRVTSRAGLDSRPAWAPDGARLAFVRDDTLDTRIVELDLASGTETTIVSTGAADLDPAYAPDGSAIYYASAAEGDLDIWRLDLETKERQAVVQARGLDLRPQPAADGALVYVAKRGGGDEIVAWREGKRQVLAIEPVASTARPAVSPDGRRVAVTLPHAGGASLYLLDVAGGPSIVLVDARAAGPAQGPPVMPAWSADGRFVYYVRANDRQSYELWRIPSAGGDPEPIAPSHWDWGVETARLVVRTRSGASTVPARLHVAAADGHAAFAAERQAWFDGQNGLVFTYSPGTLEFEIPAGDFRVLVAYGFAHAPAEATGTARPGQTITLDVDLQPINTPSLEGWYSGDHHFHLNYGGTNRLAPDDLVPMMRGENLDVATPLMANLHTRLADTEFTGWARQAHPLIAFGQEVRSHFLGHTGHIGIASTYWPWFWGPGYPVHGRDDRSNSEALADTRRAGGVTAYVHPVTPREPFPPDGPPRGLPLEFVSDAVLGDVDTIEVVCLWSDALGTSDAWYRVLNIGVPLMPSAGTDVMTDFFRTMAVGTTRIYVRVPGELTLERYLDGVRRGRSFVTTAPLLRFAVGGVEAGDVVRAGAGASVGWELAAASAVPFERVEIVVNGEVAWSGRGLDAPGTATYAGTLEVPAGGWVAARVHGGPVQWPAMATYPFAHTAPVWFGSVGSRDPAVAARAARDLLAALDVAEARLVKGYGGAPVPNLRARIAAARERLVALSDGSSPR
ncbi:MAG: CehA/McbA family metallohydrolase [Acidobacteria bacterium]|nr:CehA/McbA family metallohydrolase [Acidobacteriota bacterium]MBA3884235.1 CehA/McbA family metallohydrolase [Acidobacteriota bacterium]